MHIFFKITIQFFIYCMIILKKCACLKYVHLKDKQTLANTYCNIHLENICTKYESEFPFWNKEKQVNLELLHMLVGF